MRLDQYICSLQLKGLETRNQLKRLQTKVWKDGSLLKFSHQVKDGEELLIHWEQAQHYDASSAVPMDLDILYEDANLLVLNKPQGLAVHGAPSLHEPSLVQGLIAKYQDLLQNFDTDSEFRPGIVHRLDKDTSGVLLIARNTEILRLLSEQFAKRRVQKTYYAIVHGRPKQGHGTVDLPLMRDPKAPQRYTVYKPQRLIGRFGGQSMNHEELQDFYRDSGFPLRNTKLRNAETQYRVLRTWQNFSLVRLRPSTGRTHQLRVHLKHLNCPIVGDPIYGKKQAESSLMLHAFRLEFYYPDDASPMRAQVATPKHFREFLQSLR